MMTEAPTTEASEQQLRDAAAILRRTAQAVRTDGQERWLEIAMDLEDIARRQEARADELAGATA